MAMKTLDGLFVHFPRDMHDAEKQRPEAPPKMAPKADASGLREAFESRREEAGKQI